MRIGMILDKGFPSDIRVEKEARALTAGGHEVHLLSYRDSGPGREEVDGIHVHRIERQSGLSRKWNAFRFYRSFHNPYWARRIKTFVQAHEIEAIHVHDLPLVGTAATVGRRLGRPVVADLHENYPAALQAWGRSGWKADPERWTDYEGRATRACDRVIVVVDEMREKLTGGHSVDPDQVVVVMNTDDPAQFGEAPAPESDGPLLLSYVGTVNPHRGLETVVSALRQLEDIDVRLKIVGSRPPYHDTLAREVEEAGVAARVELTGWQPSESLPSLMREAHVGLVPHLRNGHTDTTVPHKLFQYMLVGRPVIVSDCPPLERIVGDAACGRVFRGGDAEALARCIRELHADPALQQRLGSNGARAARGTYAWKHDAGRLLRLYESLRTAARA